MDVTGLYHHAVPLPSGSSLDDSSNTYLVDVPGLTSVALLTGQHDRNELAATVVYLPTRSARHARLATPVPATVTSGRPLSGNRVLIAFRAGWRALNRYDPIYLVVLDCNTMTFGTPTAVARAGGDTGGYGVYGMPGMHQASETEWTAVLIGLRNPPLDETDPMYGGEGPPNTGIWGFQSPLHPQKLGIIGGTSLPTGNLRWYDGYKYDLLTRRVSIRGTAITVDYSPWSVTAGFTVDLNPYYFNLVQNHSWLSEYSWTDEPGLLSTTFLHQEKMSYDRNYWDWDAAQGNYDQRNFLQRGETNFMAVQLSFVGQVLTGVQTTPLRTSIGDIYATWWDASETYPYHVGLMGPKVFGNGHLSVVEYTRTPWEPMFGGADVAQIRRGRPGTVPSPEGPPIKSADYNYYRGGTGIWDSFRWHRAGVAVHMFDYPVTEGDWSGERWIDFRVGAHQGRIRSSRLAGMPVSGAMKVDLEPYGMPWGQFGDLIYTQSGCFVGLWSFTDLAAHGGLAISVFKVGDTGINNLGHGQHRSKGVFS